jgi:hypothetical protein
MDVKRIQSFISKLQYLLASDENRLRALSDDIHVENKDFSAGDIADIEIYLYSTMCNYKVGTDSIDLVEMRCYNILDRASIEGICIRSKADWGKAAADLFVIVAAIDDGVILRLAKDPCSTLQLVSYKALKDFYVAQDGHTLGKAVAVDYEDMMPVEPKT